MLKVSNSSALIFGGRALDGKFSNALKLLKFSSSDQTSISVETIESNFPALASSSLVQLSEERFLVIGGLLEDGSIRRDSQLKRLFKSINYNSKMIKSDFL